MSVRVGLLGLHGISSSCTGDDSAFDHQFGRCNAASHPGAFLERRQQLMGRQLLPNQRQLSGPIHRSLGILLDCTSKTKEILSNTDSTNKRQSATAPSAEPIGSSTTPSHTVTVVAFAGACVIARDGGHDV